MVGFRVQDSEFRVLVLPGFCGLLFRYGLPVTNHPTCWDVHEVQSRPSGARCRRGSKSVWLAWPPWPCARGLLWKASF